MKKEKVERARPIYAKEKTLKQFNKRKIDRNKVTSDQLLNYLLDVEQEVNRRK